MSPCSSVLLLVKTIMHPAARSLCDSWASCFDSDIVLKIIFCTCLYVYCRYNKKIITGHELPDCVSLGITYEIFGISKWEYCVSHNAVGQNVVFAADYLTTKTRQPLSTAKQDYRRYQKKHQTVTTHLIYHQSVGLMLTVAVIWSRLTEDTPRQHSLATQWHHLCCHEMRNSPFLMTCLRRWFCLLC